MDETKQEGDVGGITMGTNHEGPLEGSCGVGDSREQRSVGDFVQRCKNSGNGG
jgi:hypothetical protein